MKIDFNGEKMSIHFDKVPRLLYFNENGEGCGAIFIDGQRKKALVSVNIQSKTRDVNRYPLFYEIQTYNSQNMKAESIVSGEPYYDVNVNNKEKL